MILKKYQYEAIAGYLVRIYLLSLMFRYALLTAVFFKAGAVGWFGTTVYTCDACIFLRSDL